MTALNDVVDMLASFYDRNQQYKDWQQRQSLNKQAISRGDLELQYLPQEYTTRDLSNKVNAAGFRVALEPFSKTYDWGTSGRSGAEVQAGLAIKNAQANAAMTQNALTRDVAYTGEYGDIMKSDKLQRRAADFAAVVGMGNSTLAGVANSLILRKYPNLLNPGTDPKQATATILNDPEFVAARKSLGLAAAPAAGDDGDGGWWNGFMNAAEAVVRTIFR